MRDWRGLLENENEAVLLAATAAFFGVAPHSYFPEIEDPFEALALDQALYLTYKRVERDEQKKAEKEADREARVKHAKDHPGTAPRAQPPTPAELLAKVGKR